MIFSSLSATALPAVANIPNHGRLPAPDEKNDIPNFNHVFQAVVNRGHIFSESQCFSTALRSPPDEAAPGQHDKYQATYRLSANTLHPDFRADKKQIVLSGRTDWI